MLYQLFYKKYTNEQTHKIIYKHSAHHVTQRQQDVPWDSPDLSVPQRFPRPRACSLGSWDWHTVPHSSLSPTPPLRANMAQCSLVRIWTVWTQSEVEGIARRRVHVCPSPCKQPASTTCLHRRWTGRMGGWQILHG